jgi:transcriptional regulator with XRE-family HTH domain
MNFTLGEKIGVLRRRKKLTQKEFAKVLGINISNICKYESDTYNPSYSVLIKMAKFFDISTDDLLI